MPRIRMMTIVGTLAACMLFACGDKNAPLSPSGMGGTLGGGGEGGSGPTIDGGGGSGGSPGVSFAVDILPLMKRACDCHVSGSIAPALNNYANVKAAASASNAAIKEGSMPIGAPLSAADQALFESWVNAGMPN